MPKACDACQVSSAIVYCRADAAYLCVSCDSKVHGANKLASRHERVWVCEVCELAPAVVTCKADAAALCVSCDNEIHSANPLARRHERVPITPFYECPSMVKVAHIHSAVTSQGSPVNGALDLLPSKRGCDLLRGLEEDEKSAAEAASWLLSRPQRSGSQIDLQQELNLAMTTGSPYAMASSACVTRAHGMSRLQKPKTETQSPSDLFSEVDPYLDLDYTQSIGLQSIVTDSIVPVHSADTSRQLSPSLSNASASIDVHAHGKAYAYPTTVSHSHLSSSSLDAGVVPDGSEISTSYDASSMQFEFPPRVLHVGQLQPMAREARVMRYREKRKTRKFEKTIRYASRKAYAESRPRIKGRFAKREDKEAPENIYGIVPENFHLASF